MKRNIFFLFFSILLLESCSIKRFVAKNRQINLLSKNISADSIRIIDPAFSGYSVLGNKIEWSFPVFIGKQNIFKNHLIHLLDSQNIVLRDNFLISSNCLTNKIHAENWYDEKWDSAITYKCLRTDSTYYNLLFYNRFDVYESAGYSTISQNNFSDISSLIIVFYKSRIIYSRNFRYLKRLTNKEQKAFEKTNAYPFFKDDQIKYVVQKVTEDLFKRIQPK